jgi:hypothetical protein
MITMTELHLLRRIIDGRTRPGQRDAATMADRRAANSAAGGGITRSINCYCHSDHSDHKYGRYGRSRYDAARYCSA